MIVETGHFALILAFALALAQAVIPFAGARLGDGALMRVARPTALMQFLLVAFAYGALTYAHVVSDFSLVNVIENSHSSKPLIYKISGVWGNHEGSMLLWVLVLSLCGALIALFSSAMPAKLRADTLSVQGLLGAAFLLFILLTSNPFARVSPRPGRAATSIRSCKTQASRSIRRCFILAMSASPSCSPSPRPR